MEEVKKDKSELNWIIDKHSTLKYLLLNKETAITQNSQ